jgi:hypothetical protein
MTASPAAAAARPAAAMLETDAAPSTLNVPNRRYRYSGLATTAPTAKQQNFDAILRAKQQADPALDTTPTLPIATPTEKLLPRIEVSTVVTPDPTGPQLSGPVKGLTWSATPTGVTNLTGMIWVNTTTDPLAAAKQSLQSPPGMAGVFLWDLVSDLLSNPLDHDKTPNGTLTAYRGPWMDNGVLTVKTRLDAFFSKFKAAGGRMDFLVLDFEGGVTNWQLSNADAAAIQQDPRSAALLKSLGLTNMADVMDYRNGQYVKWNDAMSALLNNALNTAVFDVARKYFPNVQSSNFDSYQMTRENIVPEYNGNWMTPPSHAGTTNSPSLYGQIGNLALQQLVPGQTYGNTKLAVLRWEVNLMRGINLSSTDGVVPWIAYSSYTSSAFKNSSFYNELVYHAALSGAKEFLVWNPTPWAPNQKPADYSDDAQVKQLDAVLTDINAHLGAGPRTVVTPKLMAWDSNLVVSGVQVGTDKIVWRITAAEGSAAIKIAETGEVIELNGSAGVWYESKPGQSITFVGMK